MRGVCFCEKAHFSFLYTPAWCYIYKAQLRIADARSLFG